MITTDFITTGNLLCKGMWVTKANVFIRQIEAPDYL